MRITRFIRFIAVASTAWCMVGATLAHDTWLLGRSSHGKPPFVVTFDLTSGMAFPELDHAVQADRLAKAGRRLNGKSTDIGELAAGERSLVLRTRIDAPGVAAVWITSKPKSIDLTPEQVLEYFEEVGASERVRQEWAALPEPKRWHETYVKHAKTFVRAGEPESTTGWAEPVGLSFEIVPETDPTRLEANSELRVRLLFKGAPAAGFAVGLVHEGQTHAVLHTTNEEGRVTFSLDRPGRWLLKATDIRRAAPDGSGNWESDFTTLTLEVR